MGNVFVLWHTHFDESLDEGEDVKLIGVYSTKELAENALVRMSKVEGFRDHTGDCNLNCVRGIIQ